MEGAYYATGGEEFRYWYDTYKPGVGVTPTKEETLTIGTDKRAHTGWRNRCIRIGKQWS